MDLFKQLFFNIRIKNELYLLIVSTSHQQYDRGLEISPFFKAPTIKNKTDLDRFIEDVKEFAKKFDLMGENNTDRTLVELYMEHLKDLFEAIVNQYFENNHSKKRQIKKRILTEILPNSLKFIDSKLEHSSSGLLAGEYVTLADIFLVFILDWFQKSELSILDEYEWVRTHYVSIKSMPKIADSIKNVRPNIDHIKSLKSKHSSSSGESISTNKSKKTSDIKM